MGGRSWRGARDDALLTCGPCAPWCLLQSETIDFGSMAYSFWVIFYDKSIVSNADHRYDFYVIFRMSSFRMKVNGCVTRLSTAGSIGTSGLGLHTSLCIQERTEKTREDQMKDKLTTLLLRLFDTSMK